MERVEDTKGWAEERTCHLRGHRAILTYKAAEEKTCILISLSYFLYLSQSSLHNCNCYCQICVCCPFENCSRAISSPFKSLPRCENAILCPFLLNTIIALIKATGLVMNGHAWITTEADLARLAGLINPSHAASIPASGR
jgi:hypothetical protein